MEMEFRVFVVDDDMLILQMMDALLSENCKVEAFSSAAECLERLKNVRPDMFLLDVNMPEIDGLTLCRQIKADDDLHDIPVAFISASDDMETRMACYEAGGEDFILKPFQPEELDSKVKVAQRIRSQKRMLREQAGYAQKAAISAMTSMGELGVILQFLSTSFTCNTLRQLGEKLLEAAGKYELQCAVQVRLGEHLINISPNGLDLPLEVGVLNHVRNQGKVFQFKSRCVFNCGGITLLVNNMPIEDEDRCGRIRDNCSILAEGANARLRAIEAEEVSQRRRNGIIAALPHVKAALEAQQGNYRRNAFQLTESMIAFQETLSKSYMHLGLTDGQEHFITDISNNFMQRMVGTQDESLQIVAQLEGVAKTLEDLLKD